MTEVKLCLSEFPKHKAYSETQRQTVAVIQLAYVRLQVRAFLLVFYSHTSNLKGADFWLAALG